MGSKSFTESSKKSPSRIWNSWSRIRPTRFEDEDRFHGRYNIAPRTYSPVIRRQGSEPELILQSMRWGVVPHYSKHEDKSLSTINAKGEHLTDGTSTLWNGLKGKKRCVVPVQGYYEWLKKSATDKVPHFTRYKDEKIMMLAGMWDVVTLEGSTEPLYTFTIVTTDSSKQLSFLHDRMPVILTSEDDIELWLSDSDWSKDLARLVKPCEEITFDCYPVPTEVGKVGNEDPSFIHPVSERKDGIEAMFKRQAASSPTKAKPPPSSTSHTVSPSSKRQLRSPSPPKPIKQELLASTTIEIYDSDEEKPNTSIRDTRRATSPQKLTSPKKRKEPSTSSDQSPSSPKKSKKNTTDGPKITQFFKSKSS